MVLISITFDTILWRINTICAGIFLLCAAAVYYQGRHLYKFLEYLNKTGKVQGFTLFNINAYRFMQVTILVKSLFFVVILGMLSGIISRMHTHTPVFG
ncbi:MAG TPA: hypothetical protein VM802_08250 [Chitinophaga sp.]|uniref:hypothetical protein n=1 Tax=Chitinophaga sp. TaxID=1869181 RepID=UPI002D009402|nr:hypothetical protein [Chitinophaga sp.]HVI44847.1 hypothetical protein [Chitinophaga sp.]